MKPWKSYRKSPHDQYDLMLQWGHGDEAVEEVLNVFDTMAVCVLQWGHGDEAVEEARTSLASHQTA